MIPLVLLLPAVVALAALAYWKRIYPHRPLVLLALAPSLLSIGLIARPGMLWPLFGFDALLIVVALIDLLSLPARGVFEAQRQTGRIASVRKPHRVTLTISNRSGRAHLVWLRDGIPHELKADPPEFTLLIAPQSRSAVQYTIVARRRGSFDLTAIHLRVRSPWGLWQRYLDFAAPAVLYVYPDISQLSEYAVLARTNRLSLMGVRRTRRIGQDNEFERLRDYTLDDNYKHIDWRSTARRGKLTVKDFQANQSQRLIFLLDCGRMMTNTHEGLTLLDHALNAVLMLSFVALRQGDSVGLLAFSDEIHGFVPPRGGMNQMNKLLHASFNRFPRLVESRYDQAFLYLAAHCRKRSLVVLITNLIDEVNSHQIEQYLSSLVGRHLPLAVLLRDHRLFDVADADVATPRALYRAAAASEILSWRAQVLRDLEANGVLALDVFPEETTAPLVNRYLDVKARHLL